jgi:hypothetical protein
MRDQGLTYVVAADEGVVGADAEVTGQQSRHLIGAISKRAHHHCQVTLHTGGLPGGDVEHLGRHPNRAHHQQLHVLGYLHNNDYSLLMVTSTSR